MKMLMLSRRWGLRYVRGNHTYSLASLHVDGIQKIVGKGNIISSSEDMESYTQDWTKTYTGGSLVCFPKTTSEVSEVLKYCSVNRIGVVPQGGNTGLVGGGVGTNKGELIMSMKRMNKILEVDASAGSVTCEAGCVLEWLNNEVGKQGFVIPLDLGAKGSCMIGGNVATNAGGLRVMKYGSLQGNVLGLEVVLADGTVVDMLRTLRKDNCGLHSKHLFVGSEGVLGVITKVSLLLATKPTFSCVIFAKLASFSQVSVLLRAARSRLGDTLTAFEFMDRNAIDAVRRAAPGTLHSVQPSVLPAAQSAPTADGMRTSAENMQGVPGEVAVLLECTGTDAMLDQQRVDAFAQAVLEEGVVEDALLSLSAQQEKDLWRIREELTLCLAQLSRSTSPLYPALSTTSAVASTAGAVKKNIEEEVETVQGGAVQGRLFKYDLSVRLQDTAELLRRLKQRVLQAGFRLKGVTAPSSARDSSEGSGSGSGGRNDLARLFSACELEFCNYGHIADQNIHLNILAAVSTTGGGNLTPSDSSSGGMLHRQSVDVPVPSDGVYAKYRKPVAAGAALDYIHAVFLSRGPGVAAVQVEVASVVAFTAMVRNELNRHIFDLVLEMKGSISAEHGVGAQKAGALSWARSPAELAVMRSLKQALDPGYILNPGKVLSLPER